MHWIDEEVPLLIGSFLQVLVLSVAGGKGVACLRGMRIKNPDIEEGSLKVATPEPTCESGTIIRVGSGVGECFTGDWL